MRRCSVGTVLSLIRIVPRPGQEEHTLRALRSLADSVRAQPGCAAAEILREGTAPAAFVYAETWHDEGHLARRVTSPDYALILGLVESSAEPPSVEFHFVSETRGLAWVEELRLRGTGSPEGGDAVVSGEPHGAVGGGLRTVGTV